MVKLLVNFEGHPDEFDKDQDYIKFQKEVESKMLLFDVWSLQDQSIHVGKVNNKFYLYYACAASVDGQDNLKEPQINQIYECDTFSELMEQLNSLIDIHLRDFIELTNIISNALNVQIKSNKYLRA